MNDRRRVAVSVATLATFVLLGKAFGAAREVILAAYYGTSPEIDAYLLATGLLGWPLSVWLSTLTVTLVPLLIRAKKNSENVADEFVKELCVISLLIGTTVAALAAISMPLAIAKLAPALTGHTLDVFQEMLPVVSITVPLGFVGAVFAVRMISSERHVNTLLEGVPAVFVSSAVLIGFSGGADALIWGTILGSFVQLFLLIALQRTAISRPDVSLRIRSPLWSTFVRSFSLVAAGQVILSATTIIDQLMVADIGSGSVAILGYGNRIVALGLALGATVMSRATLPVFSDLQAIGGDEVRKQLLFWMSLLFALGCAGILIGWYVAPFFVQTLYERGAFTHRDTELVALVLQYGLLQMPFYFAAIVCTQVLAAQGRYERLLQVALLMIATKILGNLALVPQLGIIGVQLSTAAMYLASLIFLWNATRLSARPSQAA